MKIIHGRSFVRGNRRQIDPNGAGQAHPATFGQTGGFTHDDVGMSAPGRGKRAQRVPITLLKTHARPPPENLNVPNGAFTAISGAGLGDLGFHRLSSLFVVETIGSTTVRSVDRIALWRRRDEGTAIVCIMPQLLRPAYLLTRAEGLRCRSSLWPRGGVDTERSKFQALNSSDQPCSGHLRMRFQFWKSREGLGKSASDRQSVFALNSSLNKEMG